MNQLKIFDQTFTDKKNFVFLILFELLNNAEFENLLPNEYKILLNQFNQNIEFSNFQKLDFDNMLNKNNKSSFIKIFESIYTNKLNLISKSENEILKSKLFQNKDFKKIGKIIYKELDNKTNENDIYKTILNALEFETFYELSIVNAKELLDNWISIKESGQLRINYNMTDWMQIGSKIELKIVEFNSEFYKFICLSNVIDYNSRETSLINVYETNVQIKDGYFYHYNYSSNEFIYKKPIYEFENDTFKTQINDYEFVFQRKNNG
jgi:hypothetical protein